VLSAMIKLPKGTQDYFRGSYNKLSYLKDEITKLFTKYNGEFVETPVFELTQVLTSKYGEEEKLIFNIESSDDNSNDASKEAPTVITAGGDVGKERVSLRYDHTVPLVRFCLVNRITKMRRCCIGKVYRRETTTRTQMRLREFYQADFDYVGAYDELVPELEIMCMIQELFKTIGVSNYQILYNYRQNLDHYVNLAKIDKSMFATVCSSIDKLDKKTPEYVRTELIEKGLSDAQVTDLFSSLFSETPVMESSIKTLDDTFKKYLSAIKVIDTNKIVFTPTLARGSDYYTGIIFEVKLTDSDFTSSVAGGGRYDKLIGSYSKVDGIESKDCPKDCPRDCPMIGFSFGVDRLLPFIKDISKQKSSPKIWISTIGKIDDPVKVKLDLIGRMMDRGYGVFYNLSERKFKKEISDADESGCNYMIIVGEKEWADGKVCIRNMDTREQITIEFKEVDNYFNSL
ncbi:histidine-tRNA ligase, partial [Yasminevirus sp. GU-2018]